MVLRLVLYFALLNGTLVSAQCNSWLLSPGRVMEKELAYLGKKLNSTAVKSYRSQYNIIKLGRITSEQRQFIQQAYRKSDPNVASLVFEFHLEKLLKNLPDKVQDKVKHLEYEINTISDFMPIKAYFVRNTNREKIVINLPQRYQGTEIEFLIKSHEVYHAAVHFSLRHKHPIISRQVLLNGMFDIKTSYFNELGAVTNEWQFLDSLPSRIKDNILEQVLEDENLLKANKELLASFFRYKSRNVADYIIHQQSLGRYSKNHMIDMAKRKNILLKKIVKRHLVRSLKIATILGFVRVLFAIIP